MPAGRTSSERRPPVPVVDPARIPSVDHGGAPPGGASGPRVDLSLSTNPYGPPPYFGLALARARREVAAYPDRAQAELTDRLEARLRLDRGTVLPGGSGSELLRDAIVAYGARRRVLLPAFTYGEYRRVAASVGARVLSGPMPGFAVDPGAWALRVPARGLVVLPNPGTPSGQYLAPRAWAPLIEAVERRRALLLIDESYLPFVRGGQSLAGTSDHVLTVFSWSKLLGTPGVPLGHATGARGVLRVLRGHLLPWSVGPIARHLGLLALERPAWAESTLGRVERTAMEVRRELGSASQTHYFMVRAGSGSALARRLARAGFRVRDLTSMGLPEYVRFAARRPRETREFLSELLRAVPGARAAARSSSANS